MRKCCVEQTCKAHKSRFLFILRGVPGAQHPPWHRASTWDMVRGKAEGFPFPIPRLGSSRKGTDVPPSPTQPEGVSDFAQVFFQARRQEGPQHRGAVVSSSAAGCGRSLHGPGRGCGSLQLLTLPGAPGPRSRGPAGHLNSKVALSHRRPLDLRRPRPLQWRLTPPAVTGPAAFLPAPPSAVCQLIRRDSPQQFSESQGLLRAHSSED